jgi:uncharacterized membrane protein YsdA (DUF1294 family)/cold shock CspA family protein
LIDGLSHGDRGGDDTFVNPDPAIIGRMPGTRLEGTLISWDDDRGFGFIRPSNGSRNVFVHIRAFVAAARRPQAGDSLDFRLGRGPNGRIQAQDVRGAGPAYPTRSRPAGRGAVFGIIVIALFVGAIILSNSVAPLNVGVIVVYAAMSAATFIAYGVDKWRARSGRWRVSEAALLVMGFVGGWPGAIIAQQLFRHKTRKASFQRAFWGSVALNLLIFAIIAVQNLR